MIEFERLLDDIAHQCKERLGQPIRSIACECKVEGEHEAKWCLTLIWYDRNNDTQVRVASGASLAQVRDRLVNQRIPQQADLAAILGYDEVRS